MKKKKILFVSSEAAPFVKTGGLGDVAGSLPAAIKEKGHDIRVVLPEYGQMPAKYKQNLKHLFDFRTNIVWRNEYVGVNTLTHNDVPFYFIDNKYFFDRYTLYDNSDRHVQFILFMRAVLEILPKLDFKPDIIHCNDWQTAAIPLLLEDNYKKHDFYQGIKTVFTIHNLRYQGVFAPEILDDALGIDKVHYYNGNIRHDGLVNFMKAGIMYSDKITTVSETYAKEIKTPYYGEGLDYALRMRGDDLEGIVNGISYRDNNPATDSEIFANFDENDLTGKTENRRALQSFLGLKVDSDKRIISIISRLVEQKGIDLITAVAEEIVSTGMQFIILGTGNSKYESFFRDLARRYPQQVAAEIRYDFTLAKRIYAGSDFFLMPSRFEPCGLGQLLAMRYGTVPVVRETGGLKDTVIPYQEGTGTGFVFSAYNAHEMLEEIEKAARLAQNPEELAELQQRVMQQDFSWKNSAEDYLQLYSELTEAFEKPGKRIETKEKSEAAQGNDLLDLNQADLAELKNVKGLGPAYAQRIIDYRDDAGKFSSLDDLLNVKGIGPASLEKIKPYICIK
ncbi:MAG: glycogen synthase GlgA [Bacillota bacterium]